MMTFLVEWVIRIGLLALLGFLLFGTPVGAFLVSGALLYLGVMVVMVIVGILWSMFHRD